MARTWRDVARPVIAEVLNSTKGLPDKEIRKALREAYPFGLRKYHPYKIWCDEIKVQTGQKKSRVEIIPDNQTTLFNG